IADKKMGFWSGMSLSRKVVLKHWWMTFLVVLVVALFVLAGPIAGGIVGFLAGGLVALIKSTVGLIVGLITGVLACGLSLLVTAPVAFAALCCAYEKLFGDLAPAQP